MHIKARAFATGCACLWVVVMLAIGVVFIVSAAFQWSHSSLPKTARCF